MKIIDIPISLIEENTGQLAGLPANPRKIDRANLNKLVQSIKQDPEMLDFRCLLLYPIGDKYLTIGGNMRLAALKALGYEKCPCIIIPKDTPISKLRNYIIKDNSEFGEWEYSKLLEQWDSLELEEWAVNIPDFAKEEFKEDQERKGWKSDKEAKESVCDMAENIAYHSKQDFAFISSFKKSEQGVPLSQIKSDFSNVATFAKAAVNLIKRIIGLNIKEDWALITTPKRRHKETNFAESVCEEIAKEIGIVFYKDTITAKTRQRINPKFNLEKDIKENNIIVYDDIITTGSTLVGVHKLLTDKNVIYIVGINNN